MDKVRRQIATFVSVVGVFTILGGLGYVTQLGLAQVAPSVLMAGNRASSDDVEDVPEPKEEWADHSEEELTQKDRLKNRPGNFGTLAVAADFMAGICEVEPEYRRLGFPLQLDATWIESEDDFEGWQEGRRGRDGAKRNDARLKNYEITELELFNLEADDEIDGIPEHMGFDEKAPERIARLREAHSGRFVLMQLTLRWESLTSDDINDDEVTRMIFNRRDGEWKIIYIVG